MQIHIRRDLSGKTLNPHHTQRKVLGRHQGILVKQGQLHAAESHIHNSGSLLDNRIKLLIFGRNGLIAQKTLLRIADQFYINPRPHLDLIKNNGIIFRVTESAGSVRLVTLYLIPFHEIGKIFQHLAKLIHQFIADLSFAVGIPAKSNHMADMVNGTDTIFTGNFINSKLRLKGAYRDCCKCQYGHNFFPPVHIPQRGYNHRQFILPLL